MEIKEIPEQTDNSPREIDGSQEEISQSPEVNYQEISMIDEKGEVI